MKAVVLAAGLGTRLRPITFLVPKALATVGTRPLIDFVLEWLSLNGVKEVAVVGYHMQDVLERYLRDFHPHVHFIRSRRLLGTAGQLYYARDWIEGDTVVANVDVITNLDLRGPLQLHRSSGAVLTVVARRTEVRLRFGVLELEGQRLAAWREKPSLTYHTAAGIYVVSRQFAEGLREEFIDMDRAAQASLPRVAVYVAKEAFFHDVGTLEDLASVGQISLEGLKP